MEQTIEVLVHKANLVMLSGETIAQFSTRLREAALPYLRVQLGLNSKDDAWTSEVFSDSAIFTVYKYRSENNVGLSSTTGRYCYYYKLPFSRDKSGTFKFSEPTEVERVENFVAVKKNNEPFTVEEIEKNNKEAWAKKNVFKGVIL